jgi:CRISPR-associated endoribonuclease Cas6
MRALEPLILPSYKGATLRGGFGNTFRRVVCALRKNDCQDCLLRDKCVYSYVFETPPPPDTRIMRKYRSAPHPFVIEPPPEKRMGYKPGDEIRFGLVLIGRAIDYLPYFIYTFDELGRMGIGKGRGKYELMSVTDRNSHVRKEAASQAAGEIMEECEEVIYSSATKTMRSFEKSLLSVVFDSSPAMSGPEPLILDFLTPARIVYEGHLTIDPEFHVLIRQLLRRISLLAYFHCGADPSEIDFRDIIRKSERVTVKESKLRWYDWERYSARQDTKMKMGGFTGQITFEGEISPFMTLIRAGEVLHVGKGTSFGLGRFRVR